jgi:IclR family acetate operon transcriptional repressor
MTAQSSGSSSVLKAFAILDLIAASGVYGVSLNDVSRHLSGSKSTAHRYLQTLEALGVVERDERGCFHLGVKIIELSGAYNRNVSLIQQSWPTMKELASFTEETVHVAVPSGNEVVFVAKVDSTRPIGVGAKVGTRAPMHCTASGKAILSGDRDGRWLKEITKEGLEPRTAYTLTSPEELDRELEEIRERGYAVDNQEYEMGVSCVSAPVSDYRREVVGAISVSAPAIRLTDDHRREIGSRVRLAARDISRRMGHPVPVDDWSSETN